MRFTSLARRPLSISRVGALSGVGRSGSATPADPTTFLALTSSGASRVPSDLTVNSVTVSPGARYEGASLTGTDGTWPGIAGPTMTNTGAGNSVVAAFAPFTGVDAAVAFANGKSMQVVAGAPATAAFDLGTNDFVITIVVATTAATSGVIRKAVTGTLAPGVGNAGWQVSLAPSLSTLTLSDGVNVVTLTATLASGTHNVIEFFCDRSEASVNGGHAFVNGALNSTGDLSAAVNINAAAGALQMGINQTGPVTFFSVHQSAAWFAGGATNATQWLASAKTTSSQFEGTYAATALGTATPVTRTRSTSAYLDRVIATSPFERRLFSVGVNWSRLCRRREVTGGEDLSGAVQEAQSTNLCLQSQAFDNASWTKVASTISADGRAAPDGSTTADGIIGSAATVQHGATQAVTLTAAGYLASFFVEAGNQTHCFIENATIATGRVWFNLSTGAVGTKEAGIIEALIEPYGLGRYRISARFTGTAAAHTIGINAASADNTATFLGDAATVNTWVWGAQVELAPQDTLPSTYVPTTTATVTRAVDTLTYKTDDGNFALGSGRLDADLLYTFNRTPTNVHATLLIAAAASASGDYIDARTNNTTGFTQVRLAIASVTEYAITGTTSLVDGEKHNVLQSWATNVGKLLVDGAQQGATDTIVTTLAAAPANMVIGNVTASAYQNAIIGNVRLRNTAEP